MPSPKLKKKKKFPFGFGCGLILIDTKKLAIVFMFRTSQLLWLSIPGGIWNIPIIQSAFIVVWALKYFYKKIANGSSFKTSCLYP